MLKTNFKTVATVLALHVPKELATQLAQLKELNSNGTFDELYDTLQDNVLNLMHKAFKNLTATDTPLNVLPIFQGAFESFVEHEGNGTIMDFVTNTHNSMPEVIEMLRAQGITVTMHDDGITIETKGPKTMTDIITNKSEKSKLH